MNSVEVKERLHQIINDLPDATAEDLLHRLENGSNGSKGELIGETTPKYGIHALAAALEEMGKNAPQEEIDRLPIDLSENLDHYLYGTSKR